MTADEVISWRQHLGAMMAMDGDELDAYKLKHDLDAKALSWRSCAIGERAALLKASGQEFKPLQMLDYRTEHPSNLKLFNLGCNFAGFIDDDFLVEALEVLDEIDTYITVPS